MQNIQEIKANVETLACQISQVEAILSIAVGHAFPSDVDSALYGAMNLLKSTNQQAGEIALALGNLNSEAEKKVDLWNVTFTTNEALSLLEHAKTLLEGMLSEEGLEKPIGLPESRATV